MTGVVEKKKIVSLIVVSMNSISTVAPKGRYGLRSAGQGRYKEGNRRNQNSLKLRRVLLH
jgi:hypothetical protein